MSVYNSLTEAIQAVQVNMRNVAIVNDPENYNRAIGTLDYLMAAPRTIDIIQQQSIDASKYRPVQIRYLPKKGTSDVLTSDALATCTATNTRRESIQTLNTDLFVFDKFTLQEEIIREGTQEQLQARIQREIMAATRNCRENMNAQSLSTLAGVIGSNPGHQNGSVNAGSYASVQVLESDGTVDADNFDVVINDRDDNYMVGNVALIGHTMVRKFKNRLMVGSGTDGGVDIREVAAQYGVELYLDHDTTSQLSSANNVLACYAGLQQWFGYNVFGSDFELSVQNHIRARIPDPIYPRIIWDFILKYSDECDSGNGIQGEWTGRLFKYFDIWTPPDTAFGEPYGDLADFTGVVGYTFTQGT